MDGLLIAAVVEELRQLLPARVERVFQPEPALLTLRLYAGRELTLLLAADPQHPRMYLTGRPPANPPAPPAFCMLLRKHLEGTRLVAVRQGDGFDRWVELRFTGPGRGEAPAERRLVAELIDRRANVLLLDGSGHILDALRRVAGGDGGRVLVPGTPYTPPPPPGRHPGPGAAGEEPTGHGVTGGPDGQDGPSGAGDAATGNGATRDRATGAPPAPGAGPGAGPAAALAAAFRAAPPDRPAWRAVLACTPAVGRELAREAVRQAGADPDAPAAACPALLDPASPALARLAETLAGWLSAARAGRFDPVLVRDAEGRARAVAAFPLTPPPGGRLERAAAVSGAPSPSALCDRFFRERLELEAARRLRQRLAQLVREALARAERRREAQRADWERAERAEPYRLYGELLTAFAAQVPRGARQAELPNYYDPQGRTITVPLDPALSPQENAQRYFRLYQKAKRGRDLVAERLRATEEEVRYLQSVEHALEEAESLPDLEAIAAELAEQGYLDEPAAGRTAMSPAGGGPGGGGARAAGGARRGDRRPGAPAGRGRGGERGAADGFLRYRGPGGETILVGKNNRQNDALVTRVANGWDIWLHAKDVPGSHVLLRRERRQEEPPEEALLAAARLAAFHSKARWAGRVAVDYTEARHVRKPRGARPGFVIYEHARTLFVSPDPEGLPPRWDAGEGAPAPEGESGSGGEAESG